MSPLFFRATPGTRRAGSSLTISGCGSLVDGRMVDEQWPTSRIYFHLVTSRASPSLEVTSDAGSGIGVDVA